MGAPLIDVISPTTAEPTVGIGTCENIWLHAQGHIIYGRIFELRKYSSVFYGFSYDMDNVQHIFVVYMLITCMKHISSFGGPNGNMPISPPIIFCDERYFENSVS